MYSPTERRVNYHPQTLRLNSPPVPSPFSSPKVLRSARFAKAAALSANEKRQLLSSQQQKIVIIPGAAKESSKVKITVGSTSDDSSDGGCTSNGHCSSIDRGIPENGAAAIIRHKLQSNPSWPPNFLSADADRLSVRSLASIGMGSTDGRKLTIRKVPTSPTELLNIAPPATPGELSSCSDCSDCSSELESERYSRRGRRGRPTRDHWANKLQFVLACVGYSVGLGNLWRFPYLCYNSGGGVFLIPYYLILIVCGIPLLYMELAVGQFTRRGPIGAFSKLCPLFKGAGISSVVVSFFVSTYYNVIIAYALFYFFTAFHSSAPWSLCTNRWNTGACWNGVNQSITKPNISQAPVEEFYDRKVLQLSSGIETPGNIRWELAACLLFSWIMVYFALWKSVRSSGKVLYFTATAPFLLVLAFLGRSLTLEGAEIGLNYLFSPQWHLLADAKVWINAAAQNFNSIGIAFGSVISFASYNHYNNNILIDTITVSAINGIASLVVGVFTFATIGNIALEHDTSIENVVADGPGLVFVVYPQAMSKMPFSSFWAVCFFFMLLCLGLNSQFAIVEVVVTSVQDGFPNWIKKKLICHEILVLAVCTISFVLGLPHITQGGIYFLRLVDHFAVSNSVVYIAFFEVIAVAWFYGGGRLARNIERMTGSKPYFFFNLSWTILAPAVILGVWIFGIVDYEPPTYDNDKYKYPWWAEVVGWLITAACLIAIPLFAAYNIAKAEGKSFFKKLTTAIKPQIDDIPEPEPTTEEPQKQVQELNNLIECKVQSDSDFRL